MFWGVMILFLYFTFLFIYAHRAAAALVIEEPKLMSPKPKTPEVATKLSSPILPPVQEEPTPSAEQEPTPEPEPALEEDADVAPLQSAPASKYNIFYKDGQNLDNCLIANSAKRVSGVLSLHVSTFSCME